jgi:hypothetical protein
MLHRAQLTERGRTILYVLANHVRELSAEQIARTWWPDAKAPATAARQELRRLYNSGMILLSRAPAHPELDFISPQSQWTPGAPTPNFAALSYLLKKRWNQHPVMTTSAAATKKAANMFGGHGGRLSRDVERTHDIHLARAYLLYRKHRPELLPFWHFEDQVRREREATSEMIPDAVINSSELKRAVEFGGSYSKEKLEAFHYHCAERNLSYEIW